MVGRARTPCVTMIRPHLYSVLIGAERYGVRICLYLAFPQPGISRRLVSEVLTHLEIM